MKRMSPIEQMFIESIEDWCVKEMEHYTDKQYGKGEFKQLLEKAQEMLTYREEHWDDDDVTNKYPGSSHIVPLINCPICDSPAQFLEVTQMQLWGAECTKCGLYLGEYSSRLDLCNDWNLRKACTYCTRADSEDTKRLAIAFYKKYLNEEGDNGD